MALQVFGTPALRKAPLGRRVSEGIGAGVESLSKIAEQKTYEKKREEFRNAMREGLGVDIPEGATEKESLAIIGTQLAAKAKEKLLEQKTKAIGNPLQNKSQGFGKAVRGGGLPQEGSTEGVPTPTQAVQGAGQIGQGAEAGTQEPPEEREMRPAYIPDEEIARIYQIDPDQGKFYENMKANDQRKLDQEAKAAQAMLNVKSDREFKEKLLTRAEDTEQSKPILMEADQALKNLPIQEQAIEDIRSASTEVGFRDFLADKFGFEPLRTAEGAKLKTAVKDFFLSDLTRAGGRPNQFLEIQLADALPKVGRDPIANLITAEGMKFKVDLAKERVRLTQELAQQDREKFGWVRGDLASRVDKRMKPYVEKRQRELANDVKDIKSGKKKFEKTESKMIDLIGPNGEEAEIHIDEMDQLPEGWSIA